MKIPPEHREALREAVKTSLEAQIALWDTHRAIECELDCDLNGLESSISTAAVCWDPGDPVTDEILDSLFDDCSREDVCPHQTPWGEACHEGDCFREATNA